MNEQSFGLIKPHGGFRTLKSFEGATFVYDLTFEFCQRFVHDRRLRDQMVHAARSGRQNIAEGCQASGTSKKTEIKLVNVARASQEELLLDYCDYLRQRSLSLWGKDDPRSRQVRDLAYRTDRSYKTYLSYFDSQENAANTVICLIHQTNYLLDRQLRSLESAFLQEGGFSENLYKKRVAFKQQSVVATATTDLRRGVDYIGVCCVFICHDGQGNLLLHKRSAKCRDEQGCWDCGGGAMEFGESFEEAARREISEEYGTEPLELKFVVTHNVLRKNGGASTHWLANIFVARLDPSLVQNNDPEKIDSLGWFPSNNLPEPLHSQLIRHLTAARKTVRL